jgi:hypothetical protein
LEALMDEKQKENKRNRSHNTLLQPPLCTQQYMPSPWPTHSNFSKKHAYYSPRQLRIENFNFRASASSSRSQRTSFPLISIPRHNRRDPLNYSNSLNPLFTTRTVLQQKEVPKCEAHCAQHPSNPTPMHAPRPRRRTPFPTKNPTSPMPSHSHSYEIY